MRVINALKSSLKASGIKDTGTRAGRYILKKMKYYFGRLPIVIAYYYLLILDNFRPRNKSYKLKVLGLNIWCSDFHVFTGQFREIFLHRTHEFIAQTPTDAMTFIDAGANIGLSTLFFKKKYPDAKVLLFEPNPDILPFLNYNIKQNHLGNTTIIEAALAGSPGELSFSGTHESGRVGNVGEKKVRAETLSTFINEKIDYLKLDIEGAEVEVIAELETSSKLKFVQRLCIEFHSFAGSPQYLGQILEILERNNFQYLINHVNYTVNPQLKPPFFINEKNEFFIVIFAGLKNNGKT